MLRQMLRADPSSLGPEDYDAIAQEYKRTHPDMLIDPQQVAFILKDISYRKRPFTFLVFGLGEDSALWRWSNPTGRTVFLEDQRMWFDRGSGSDPGIEAYMVEYQTKLSQAGELLDRPDRLEIELPDALEGVLWDVILVDGPSGDTGYAKYPNNPEPPGRMCSIFMSSRLAAPGCDVFVDDCERAIERIYVDRYLGKRNLVSGLRSRTLLRHYRLGQTAGFK